MSVVDTNFVATLITATLGGGGAVALFGLIKSLIDKWTGKADRERVSNRETMDDYRSGLRDAEKRADYERDVRIFAQEELSRIIQIAYTHGVPADQLVRRTYTPKEEES